MIIPERTINQPRSQELAMLFERWKNNDLLPGDNLLILKYSDQLLQMNQTMIETFDWALKHHNWKANKEPQ